MTTQPDHDLLSRFILRETTAAEDAMVHAKVAEDPAWADALRTQAQLDLVIYDAVDALASRAPAPAPATSSVWSTWRAWLLPTLPALAVAMALLVLRTPPPTTTAYSLDILSGESSQRSTPASTLRFTDGSTLSLLLRASEPTTDRPDVSVALDGVPMTGVEVRVAPGGSIELRGTFGDSIPLPSPGSHELTIRVADTDHAIRFMFEPDP